MSFITFSYLTRPSLLHYSFIKKKPGGDKSSTQKKHINTHEDRDFRWKPNVGENHLLQVISIFFLIRKSFYNICTGAVLYQCGSYNPLCSCTSRSIYQYAGYYLLQCSKDSPLLLYQLKYQYVGADLQSFLLQVPHFISFHTRYTEAQHII